MNPNCAEKVKDELHKFLKTWFFELVKNIELMSPITMVFKENRKLRVSVDYKRPNDITIKNRHYIPFCDEFWKNLLDMILFFNIWMQGLP
jgi:hypothetical protein